MNTRTHAHTHMQEHKYTLVRGCFLTSFFVFRKVQFTPVLFLTDEEEFLQICEENCFKWWSREYLSDILQCKMHI